MNKERILKYIYWLLFYLLGIIFIYIFVLLLPHIKSVIFFIGFLILLFLIWSLFAYILNLIVHKANELNVHRGLAVLLVYVVFFVGGGFMIYKLYPLMLKQMIELSEQLPQLFSLYEELIYNMYVKTSFLPEAVHDQMDVVFARLESFGEQKLEQWIGKITNVVDIFVMIAMIQILVFYFLKDFKMIKEFSKRHIPQRFHEKVRIIMQAIDESLGSYLRGQMLVSLFVGFCSWLLFQLIGVPYALFLGILLGITNVIPYFGPFIGLVPSIMLAVTVSKQMVLYVILIVLVIQLIESNILSPFIMEKTVQIHPIAILFALLLGGELAGIVGMLVAVPVLTILNNTYLKFNHIQHKD